VSPSPAVTVPCHPSSHPPSNKIRGYCRVLPHRLNRNKYQKKIEGSSLLGGCPQLAASAGGESEVGVGGFLWFFLPESVKSYPNWREGGAEGKQMLFDVRYFSPGEVTLELREGRDSGLGFFSLIFSRCWESRNI